MKMVPVRRIAMNSVQQPYPLCRNESEPFRSERDRFRDRSEPFSRRNRWCSDENRSFSGDGKCLVVTGRRFGRCAICAVIVSAGAVVMATKLTIETTNSQWRFYDWFQQTCV